MKFNSEPHKIYYNDFHDSLTAYRYCVADERLLETVRFLDVGDGAGWELLQVSLLACG